MPQRRIGVRQGVSKARCQERQHQLAAGQSPVVGAVGPPAAVVAHQLGERTQGHHPQHAALGAQVQRQRRACIGSGGGGGERQAQREGAQTAIEASQQPGVTEQQRAARRLSREGDPLGEHGQQPPVGLGGAVADRQLTAEGERQRLIAPTASGDHQRGAQQALADAALACLGAERIEAERYRGLPLGSASSSPHDLPEGDEPRVRAHLRGNKCSAGNEFARAAPDFGVD